MNLAETVEQVRKAIIDEAVPDMEILRNVAHLLELNDFEYSQIPNNDDASQRWAEFLLKKAKQQ